MYVLNSYLRVYFCVLYEKRTYYVMYIGLTTTHTTIPLVYPSRVTRHASLRSHRHMFIFHHPLPLGLVSLSPHYHLSLLVSHPVITLLSVVHVSIMSRGNENFFPEKNDFFLKERNSSFSFNLLVPKLINNLR